MFWVRNQSKSFANLFADRIIQETSEYTGFYRTVVSYQIMAEFLLLDFLNLDHVRRAWVTSIVFHKTINFEVPFRHNCLCYGRSGCHWEIFVLIMSYSDGYLLKVKLYLNGSHEILSISEVFLERNEFALESVTGKLKYCEKNQYCEGFPTHILFQFFSALWLCIFFFQYC